MLAAVLIGVVAGLLAGMLGIGGGALFVPGLVFFLGESQLSAEATPSKWGRRSSSTNVGAFPEA